MALTKQRCYRHAEREAVARCPACQRFFCRECVTESAGRMLCGQCIAEEQKAETKPKSKKRLRINNTMLTVLSVILLWFTFAFLAEMLVNIPNKFHKGTIWHAQEE